MVCVLRKRQKSERRTSHKHQRYQPAIREEGKLQQRRRSHEWHELKSIRNFINKDNVKALMSMGDAWRIVFKDRVPRVHRAYNDLCPISEVVDKSALTLKNNDAG